MHPVTLHDRPTIAAFLRRETDLHLYELGDLDDFFWPYTTWYASERGGQVEDLFLLYTGTDLPILLAAAPGAETESLLRASLPFLPRRFYSHLALGLEAVFLEAGYRVKSHGVHDKMSLRHPEALAQVDSSGVEVLGPADEAEVRAFYDTAYPDNWFDPRMLQTGCTHAVREPGSGRLLAIAGIHVYSPEQRVAALGNITTLPEARGRGLGTRVTANLCKALLGQVDHIGLNVHSDNAPAIAIYRRLGFERTASYEEFMITCHE